MLTSERIAEIQSRSRADYACLDAPGFRDSLATRRDVAALLEDRAELVAEIERLRGQCVRREAMYAGMTAERDGYWEECDSLKAENERLRGLLSEWTDMDPLRYDTEYSCCPWCNFDYSNMKHEPDCPFVLARAECGISSAPGS